MDKQEFWKRCDGDMREYLLDCEEVRWFLTAFDATVVKSPPPAGIIPFPETPFNNKGYWS